MTEGQRKRIEEYLEILKTDSTVYSTVSRMIQDEDTGFGRAVYLTVFAPAMLYYVRWVLEEAKQRGVQRLYFLARDGYPMYQTAKVLCDMSEDSIDCRYLYGSRYAWRIPQFADEGEQCLAKLCLGGIDVSFEKVMKRGGLSDQEAAEVARELDFMQDYRTVLSYSEVQRLKSPLKDSRLFLPYVYAHSGQAKNTTYAYLKQEGLFDTVPYALVDSGWTGTIQQTLQELLERAGCEKQIQGYYFGLYELPAGEKQENYHAYYFGPKHGLRQKVYFSNCLYETVYSAPHGMTCGYREKNGRYEPIFVRDENLNQKKMEQVGAWLTGFLTEYYQLSCEEGRAEEVRNGATENKNSAEKVNIGEATDRTDSNVDRQRIYRLFEVLMGKPIRDEVEEYGEWLFSDDVNEDYAQEIAATLTTDEIKNNRVLNKACIMLGLRKGKLRDSAWLEGSVVKNGADTKRGLWHAAIYKYLLYIRKAIKSE